MTSNDSLPQGRFVVDDEDYDEGHWEPEPQRLEEQGRCSAYPSRFSDTVCGKAADAMVHQPYGSWCCDTDVPHNHHSYEPPAPQPVADREEAAGLLDVDEARERVIAWAGSWDEDEVPDIQLRADLAAFESAIRNLVVEQLAAVTAERDEAMARSRRWYERCNEQLDETEEAERQRDEALAALREAIEVIDAYVHPDIKPFKVAEWRALSDPSASTAQGDEDD